MKRLVLSACALTIGATLALNSWCAAENTTTINILSPRNGEKVSETFDIKYEILNAPAGNHAHVYLDGAYQKGFKGTFTSVAKGEHTITVKIADHDHKDAGTATDSITVKVVEYDRGASREKRSGRPQCRLPANSLPVYCPPWVDARVELPCRSISSKTGPFGFFASSRIGIRSATSLTSGTATMCGAFSDGLE